MMERKFVTMRPLDFKKINPDKINMTEIYKTASLCCIKKDIKCPMIVIYDIYPDNILVTERFEKSGGIIMVGDHLSAEERFTAVMDVLEKGIPDVAKIPPLYGGLPDMSALFLFAAALASSLHVACPMVLGTLKPGRFNGATCSTPDGRPTGILICNDWDQIDPVDTYITLAHEMRHVWQHWRLGKEYFAHYKILDEQIGLEEYCLQEQEVDANAYAYRVLQDIFGIDIIKMGYFNADTKVLRTVMERAEKIWPWYSPLMRLQGEIGFFN